MQEEEEEESARPFRTRRSRAARIFPGAQGFSSFYFQKCRVQKKEGQKKEEIVCCFFQKEKKKKVSKKVSKKECEKVVFFRRRWGTSNCLGVVVRWMSWAGAADCCGAVCRRAPQYHHPCWGCCSKRSCLR